MTARVANAGSNFNRTVPRLQSRESPGDDESFVEVVTFHHLESAEDFLGLCKGTVGHDHRAVAYPQRSGGGFILKNPPMLR